MIKIDLNKAKAISHEKRREARAKEFALLDVKATIPSEATEAEAQRQKVRDKYALIQSKIDKAAGVDALKGIVVSLDEQ